MNAQDLRIGNFISNGGGIFHVTELDEHGATVVDGEDYASEVYMLINNFSPISLTPEWLEKLGFNSTVYRGVDGNTKYELNIKNTHCYFEGWKSDKESVVGLDFSYYDDDGSNSVGQSVKYVHQLQNLYFALMGEELTIKEPTTK